MRSSEWWSYERRLVPHLAAPFTAALRAAAPPGRVLDLAAGTGALATALPGRVLAVDVEPDALAVAATHPGVAVAAADAAALPVATGTLDAVACQQGLQFLPDLPAALAEVRRVLRPDGALVALTWAEWGSVALFASLAALAAAELGRVDVFRDPHALPPASLAHALHAAGFVAVEQRVEERTMPRRDDADLLTHWTEHTGSVLHGRGSVARFVEGLGDRRLRAVLTTARSPSRG